MPGISGFGVTLSGATMGAVSELVGVRAPGAEANEIDITDMAATNSWKVFIAGLKEAGELTVDLIYVKANYNTLLTALGGSNEVWTVTFPDGSTFVISGFIKGVGEIDVPIDDKMTHSLTIKASGEPTFTPGA